VFRILTILILLAVLATLVNGCSKQILPTPFGEINVIRNLMDLIANDEEEIETETKEKDVPIKAERMVIGEDGEVYLMGPKKELWIATGEEDE
tara:strand:- start:29 stop:307 length:279 start_codon:yes stop_codon:yes gene_type:complete